MLAQPTFEGVQCNAARQAVLTLNTPCHDAATYSVMSPLEFMQLSIEWPVCGGQTHWFYVCSGSGPASQSPELVARNLPVELGCHTADVRLDRVPTLSRRTSFEIACLKAVSYVPGN